MVQFEFNCKTFSWCKRSLKVLIFFFELRFFCHIFILLMMMILDYFKLWEIYCTFKALISNKCYLNRQVIQSQLKKLKPTQQFDSLFCMYYSGKAEERGSLALSPNRIPGGRVCENVCVLFPGVDAKPTRQEVGKPRVS